MCVYWRNIATVNFAVAGSDGGLSLVLCQNITEINTDLWSIESFENLNQTTDIFSHRKYLKLFLYQPPL